MRDEGGFTLLEVLVAFVIAALALGTLYQGSLGGLLASRVSGQTQEAMSRARSRLAMVVHGAPLTPGERQGDDGGFYRWRVRVVRAGVAPLGRGDPASVARGPHAALYAVTVWESWGGREVRLDSEAVALAPAEAP